MNGSRPSHVLARTQGGRVEACHEGQVLLHLGALSLHLPGERLAEIAGMFREAAESWGAQGRRRRFSGN